MLVLAPPWKPIGKRSVEPDIVIYRLWRGDLSEAKEWAAKLLGLDGNLLPITFWGSTEQEASDRASAWWTAEQAKMAVPPDASAFGTDANRAALAKARAAKVAKRAERALRGS